MSSQEEEPSTAVRRHFEIGPDRGGRWVVCDAEGSCGAVFVNKEEALHFAKSECSALAGAELRLVPSLEWRSILARPTKKVA